MGKVNHIIKCETNIDHKFFIDNQEVKVLDGVNIQVELVRGKETIVILRDTSVKCNVGNIDQFALITKKMLRIVDGFTDYFKTRSFQVYNCQKIGLARYTRASSSPSLLLSTAPTASLLHPQKSLPPLPSTAALHSPDFYYTVDSSNLYLFPIDKTT